MPTKGSADRQRSFRQKKAPKSSKDKLMVRKLISKKKRSATKAKLREKKAAQKEEEKIVPEEKEEMVIQLTKSGIRYVPKSQAKAKKHMKFGVVGRHSGRGKTSRRSFGLG